MDICISNRPSSSLLFWAMGRFSHPGTSIVISLSARAMPFICKVEKGQI